MGNLDFTKLNGPNGDVDVSGYKAAIDSGTSLIMGPNTLFKPLLDGITVEQDCSNLDSLPDITFTFDTQDYVLTPTDYVLKKPSPRTPSASWESWEPTFPTTSSTSLSVTSSCASSPPSSAATTTPSPSTSSELKARLLCPKH